LQVKHFIFLLRRIMLFICALLVLANCTSTAHSDPTIPNYDVTQQLPTYTKEIVSEPRSVTQDYAETNTPTPSPTPEQDIMCNDECYEKHQEIAWSLFRYDMEETKIVDVRKATSKTHVITLIPTPLYLIPLHTDFLLDETLEAQVIDIPANVRFQIAYIKTYVHPDVGSFKIALLANNYNTHQTWLGALLIEIESNQGEKTQFSMPGNDEHSTVTFIATRDDIYFNKIINILTALKQIAVNQESKGAFKRGTEYSYLSLIGLSNGELYSIYKDGLSKYLNPVRANGVCAVATGISMLLSAEGYSSYQIKEKWTRQDLYHQSPYSFPRRLVDSVIEFGSESYQKYDLKWIQQSDNYLSFDIHLFSTDSNTIELLGDGRSGQSELGMIISIQFTSELVQGADYFEEKLKSVENLRNGEENMPVDLSSNLRLINYYSFDNPGLVGWAKLFYDAGDLKDFEEIINNSQDLQDIIMFSNTINSYSENEQFTLRSFLLDSDWRSNYSEKFSDENLNMNKIIQKGTTRQIDGQPLQCVGYVMMLTDLYPSMGFPNVSGAIADIAGDLVPDFVRGLEGRFSTGYGEIALVGKSLTIDDYNAGDFFVLKGTYGHVGAILAKNNGKLLVADSNRLCDGKVNIFVVDENNFDEVFGLEKYVVLGHR